MKKEKSYKTETLSDEERLDWLQLIRSENVGTKTFFQLMGIYGTAKKSLAAIGNMSIRGGRSKPLKIYQREKAEKEIADCAAIGARIIAKCEEEYPERLAFIPNPPPIITVLGNVEALRCDSIAMVGTRNASANGFRTAEKIAGELAAEGYVIVSGMARGIDSAVHKGAVAKGRTIAVLAGGVDVVYPPENQKLYEEIIDNGAVIAELPLSTTPRAENFPQRNRIISGLSSGVVVVEAAGRSGSLITARLALEQDREVMAVPGFPMDPRSEGPNRLIKNGAALVENSADIIETIEHAGERKIKGDIFSEDGEVYITEAPPDEEELEDLRHIVLNSLSSTPTEIDVIVELTGANVGAILSILLELELAGRLTRQPGGKVALLLPKANAG